MRWPAAWRNAAGSLRRGGLIAGQDGNLAVGLGPDRVLVTATGVIKALVEPADMVDADLHGRKRHGRHNPTSELDLHRWVLTRRPDVGAVVLAHPPGGTGLAVAGQDLHILVLPDLDRAHARARERTES